MYFNKALFARLSSRAVPCPHRGAGFSLRLALGLRGRLPKLRFDHHADEPLSRHVGSRRIRLQVASSAAGRRRLIDASLRAISKRPFFMPERSYSERSALCSHASASSSLLKSGNFLDITLDLLLVHEPHADRPDSVPAPGEDAKNPTPRAVAETQNSPLAGNGRIAHDINIAREQGLDLRQRYAMPKAFRQVAAVPVEAPELHARRDSLLHMQKQLRATSASPQA